MNVAVTAAKIFGFWKYPLKDAATSFEEMSLKDVFYWVYKCANPVVHPEKGVAFNDVLNTDSSCVKLPSGFNKTHLVSMAAGGDILQAEGLEHSKDVLFEGVSNILFDKDISYANFESPITTQPLVKEVISDREAPTECCDQHQFETLKGHKGKKFNVLNTANNHTFDMGNEGIKTTLDCFSNEGILNVGINETPEEYGQGKFLTKNGIKIGFVSATFGLNGRVLPEEDLYKINVSKLLSKYSPPDLELLKRQIDHCKSEGCDFIIASMHWGFEFEFFPRMRQIKAARELIEYGADTIISHHPHVVQPVEFYQTKRDPHRTAIIAYSLGSLTWGYSAPHLALSAILDFKIAKGELEGRTRTYVEVVKVHPVVRNTEIIDEKLVTKLKLLNDENATKAHEVKRLRQIRNLTSSVLS